ncbi:Unknown protein, partial [Striga hermonthica]
TSARTYDEVLKRCKKYINLEETEAEFAKLEEVVKPEQRKGRPSSPRRRSPRKSSPKGGSFKKLSPRRDGRNSFREGREDRWQGRPRLPNGQRYNHFTPINAQVGEVLAAIEEKLESKEVTWPATRFEGPTKPRSNKYCRFHRDYGHNTEDCRNLKDEIERLIRAGHLKEFVIHNRPRGKERRRCREDSVARSDRDDDREDDARKERRRRQNDDREELRGEVLVKRGTIYMISGGPTDGDSNNARKVHVRAVKRKREEVGITGRMPVISFRAEDAEGILLPHNDALVITAEVAGFDVKRVFTDTGSSVDVMFYDCFAQINKHLNLELKPVATALYGFNGGEMMPMGEVSLTVALGS